MSRSFVLVLVALIACGGKSAPKTTPPTEPVARPTEPAPTEPTEPAKPTEPVAPEPPKADPKAELLAAETAAWDKAKPVFDKYCANCHTKDGKKASKKKLDHFDMGTYPPKGHHTATIGVTIRDVMGLGKKKVSMPFDKPGIVKGDDLAAIQAWIDAWDAAEKGGAHPAASKS